VAKTAFTAEEARVYAALSAHYAAMRDGTAAAKPHVREVTPLRAFIDQAQGKAPAATVGRGDDVRMSAGYLRLSERERADLGSASPMVAAFAERTLRGYVEADPERDPVAAHFIERAKAAPRSTPQPTTRTLPVKEEAWIRASHENLTPGRETQDRWAELEAQIVEERAAAAAEEEAE